MQPVRALVRTLLRRRKRRGKPILSWFPANVVPTELSLMSLYELAIYGLLLLLLGLLYVKWNNVPIRNIEIIAERIDTLSVENNHGESKSTVMDISIDIPMTKVLSYSEEEGRGTFGYLYRTDDDIIDTLKLFRESNGKLQKLRDISYDYIDSERDKNLPLYYTLLNLTNFLGEIDSFDGILRESDSTFLSKEKHAIGALNYSSKYISRPNWFSQFDISQAYFDIIIKTETISRFNVNVNFVGVAEIKDLCDDLIIDNIEETKLFGNRIQYKISRNDSGYHRIRFHSQFKELENMQIIRVFFLTALLSGLVTIFLAFLVIYVYRLGRFYLSLLKERRRRKQRRLTESKAASETPKQETENPS